MPDETPEGSDRPSSDRSGGQTPASRGGGASPQGAGGGPPGAPSDAPTPERRPAPQGSVLSLSQLIGAPIHALVEAEAQAAEATAHFIRSVGFDGTGTGGGVGGMKDLGQLEMAEFKTKRLNADGKEEEVTVRIPLLSMLPIPALQIKTADLDYTVKVIQTEASAVTEAEKEVLKEMERKGMRAEPHARMRASLARGQTAGSRRTTDMLVKMKIRIEQADIPEGLGRLLALSTEFTEKRVEKLTAEEPSGPAESIEGPAH